jgi:hypothetical protein
MEANNRSLHRYRSLRFAQIVNSASGEYSDCRILDLNSKGAKIRLRRMPQTLGHVEFLFLPENIKVPAVARWLRGMECGIEFLKRVRFLEKHDVHPTAGQPTIATNYPVGGA